jgi:hypothetical protein
MGRDYTPNRFGEPLDLAQTAARTAELIFRERVFAISRIGYAPMCCWGHRIYLAPARFPGFAQNYFLMLAHE